MKQPFMTCSFEDRYFIRTPNGRMIDCGHGNLGAAIANDVLALLNNPIHVYDPELKVEPHVK